jgi:hypothetical protein
MGRKLFRQTSIACALSLGIASQPAVSQSLESRPIGDDTVISPQFLEYAAEGRTRQTAQVTSVSQLTDVQPTDWAFTALQSLVERYGCIAGYPDRTYRGQRAMTRYEFAAGLNACLDKINEIIASGLADKVSKEDLAALQRLQEEFAAELAALRGRVDALEAKTAQLEAQQFSTTTKLEGQAIIALTGGGSGNEELFQPALDGAGLNVLSGSPGDANATFVARVRLDFNTSFTGDDLLVTRLESGNGGDGVTSFLAQPDEILGFTGFGNSSGLDYAGAGSTFELGKLRYDFPVGESMLVSIGAVISLNDHLDGNSFANDESVDFSTGMFINNALLFPVNDGAGAAIDWNPGGGAFSLRLGYVAANASEPESDGNINQGLTGDPYQGTVELEFAPENSEGERPFAIRLQYTAASVNNLDYDIGGVNLEWAPSSRIGLFGRYGFGSIDGRGALLRDVLPTYVNANSTTTDLSPSYWMAGLSFPDLFKEGSIAAFAVGQPFIEGDIGNSSQTNLELFYNFPITDNISITPDLQFIFNPNNNSGNDTITIGTVRTVFTF